MKKSKVVDNMPSTKNALIQHVKSEVHQGG